MSLFDLPLSELRTYHSCQTEPEDFDAFWAATLEATRGFPLGVEYQPAGYGLRVIDCYDVTFNGYGGQPIKGWLLLPARREGRLPCVVEYIGYGGGRGFPTDWLLMASAGYAHLIMDTRGQGSEWQRGDTPDLETEPGNPQSPGFMTRGILRPETYYYRRLIADAVRAVETARACPWVDPQRVAVRGTSQGGGLALIVAGLVPDLAATLPNVPFLCDFRRATEITDADPYQEIARFCRTQRDKVEQVFQTLNYFDGVHFARRAKAPALFSTGLMDEVCPPSTVFAAYNEYAGPKEIRVWPYNHHDGGGSYQDLEQIQFLQKLWGVSGIS